MVAASSAPATRYAVFSVAGQLLALPADAVRAFVPLPRLQRVPAAPGLVEGLFRYRGEVVPVLRLDGLLGLPRGADHVYTPLILLKGRDRPVALLAERVQDIAEVRDDAILPADPALSFNGCAVGSLPAGGGRTATLLAAGRLLTETEERLLDGLRAVEAERLARWSAFDAGQASVEAGGVAGTQAVP